MPQDLIDADTTFRSTPDGLMLKHSQLVTQDLLDELHNERLAKAAVRTANFHRVASIPTVIVDLWERQGFRLDEHTPHEVVARLKAHDLDAFVATSRAV